MSKRGENIYKRKDGRWEGRYIKGRKVDGKIQYGYIYSNSYKTTQNKLIEKKYLYRVNQKDRLLYSGSVGQWLTHWLTNDIKPRVKADGISEKYYKTHLLGRISLPKINIDMPLFDTTNNDLLEIGATVLNGTSFPLGGESTHSVISAHRGLPNRALFTDLPKLKKGDTFILNVLGKTLAYQVNKIQVVTPDQTNVLKIEPGKDLVTLITCTPYMINSHRLLVTGVRVPYTEQIKKELAQSSHHQLIIRLTMIIGFLLFCLVMIWLLYRVIHGYLLSKQSITLAIRVLDEKGQPYMGRLTLHEKNGKKPLVRKKIPVALIPDKTGCYQIDNLPKRIYCLKSDDGLLCLIIGQHKLKQPMVVVQKTRRTRLPSKWHVEVTQEK
ncbi:class C sortase [Pseudolactococcus carnosus]|uniref:Class C sortase n=1 Tax=Pseudolactococcus carnosus TaxID=2749961 RepID=A0ABT0ASE3_9LACT|nr:class C sortase [Lactococcus carnosus]SCA91415.1 Conserved hypothetical protein (belonging to the Sortase family) [Lactococcus piscium]MCJ1969309.1 class C sortase [Lactococcus carnosus]MCJ1979857.1 class C sortase [Lactococcus carnosus]MCJ1989495.1 class C sortase [Lactococcus carnosus]MCJ1999740.1 class C sortase [Lactococcus carnosus]